MNAEDRANLINRVRNILKHAEENPNEGERDNAAKLATKLITKHQIADEELRRKESKGAKKVEIVTFTVEIPNAHNLGKVRASALGWAAVEPFGGSCLRTVYTSAKRATVLRVFIREDLAEVSKILIESLLVQLSVSENAAAAEHLTDWKRVYRRRYYYEPSAAERKRESDSFRRSYIQGWGGKVARRVESSRKEALEEARQEAMAEAYSTGATGEELHTISTALALPDDKQLTTDFRDQWYEARWGEKLKNARASKANLNTDGFYAGRKDGDKADIGLNAIGTERAGIGRGQRALR